VGAEKAPPVKLSNGWGSLLLAELDFTATAGVASALEDLDKKERNI